MFARAAADGPSGRKRAPPPPVDEKSQVSGRKLSHEEYKEAFIRTSLSEYFLTKRRDVTPEEEEEMRRQIDRRHPDLLPGETSGESSADEYTGSETAEEGSERHSGPGRPLIP